ncbi:TPA: LysR family transcriptional regulator [Klebsiella variicola subsp. variicola]|uniref:LysR family transcriptional regulator n=1 Tax=Klebsiella variicola TaxID=244366 RepID=UPI00291FF23C|nr:LysR substrate-binding domain-containing protein [Klebsiella variicola]HCM5244708.1 LysR family transcriptional regulator [Klebsiella variicola subsp. variicola]
MDRLDAMQLYVAVVDAHSFARAAEVLGQPRSTVSRVVKELEAWLGAQLLQRTTRKLSVTAEGRRYYEECKRLLAEMAAMEASFPGRSAQPAGRFKVGMPQSLARHCILPRIGEFLQQYPDLELILCSSDNVEDIIQEGFDCVIRTGRTIDWLFSLDDGDCAIRMQETLVVDDTDAYIQAGIQGLGLIRVASYLAQPYLQSGALVACLEQAASDLPLSLVYPQNRYLPPAVRAFYDWSRRVLQPPLSEA